MRTIIIAGRVTRDAQHKSTQSSEFCSFSVAADDGFGENRTTIFYDCTRWGKGASKLTEMLLKGTPVTVSGVHGTREHDGKLYQQIRVDNVDLQGSRPAGQGNGGNSSRGQYDDRRGGFGDAGYGADDLNDSVPFLRCDGMF